MVKKYEIHNQVTGLLEQADTYADALILQERIKQEYLEFQKNLFVITVLEQQSDGSWKQALSDENGNMIRPKSPHPSWVWNEEKWGWFAPIKKPISSDPSKYIWDEPTLSWKLVE